MSTKLSLPIPARAFLAGARRKHAEQIRLIQRLVRMESPSDTKPAVDACVQCTADYAEKLGGRVKVHRHRIHGNSMEARFGEVSKKNAEKPILLLGHLDTVWPVGTLRTMPCKLVDGRMTGPGVFDMKAGVAMAFTALEILAEADLLNREVILLLNGDEEIGSPASRPLTEKIAAGCSAVYVLEPAQEEALKTARKGTGSWHIHVTGKAAHAGVDFSKGASAVLELAHVIETVSGFTDLKRGLTVNAGVIGGGTKSNVVPEEAWVDVDVRVAKKADAARITRKFASLKTREKSCALVIAGGINRPPMERTRGTARLFQNAKALGVELGLTLEEASTGGASDGNLTAALGIPTLDGMGAVGEGAHAAHESILVEYLVCRTALLAAMLAR